MIYEILWEMFIFGVISSLLIYSIMNDNKKIIKSLRKGKH
jgi:hypothetical protein